MREINSKLKAGIYLGIITILAAALRLYHLDYQSLWLDELYSMLDSDPAISWAKTFELVSSYEYKSPVYFVLLKLLFYAFGYSGFVARLFSALAGIASIPVIYLLGKELFNRKTGLVAALLGACNYFLIYYSQEARGYSLLFLFSALSTLYFLRFLKNPNLKNAILYGFSSILAVHFHFFALLPMLSHVVVLAYRFFYADKETSLSYLKWFCISALVFLAGFIPIISITNSTVSINSMWILMPTPNYFIDYFHEYIGGNEFLKPLLLLALFSYLVKCFKAPVQPQPQFQGYAFGFVLITVSLCIIFLVPYIYSILKVPSLTPRYTIVAIPFLLLLISAGVVGIENVQVRALVIVLFGIISLTDIIVAKEYYTRAVKTQFREMTQYIAANSNKPYVIVNDKTFDQQAVYVKTLGLKNPIQSTLHSVFVDSLANENYATRYPAFWLVGAHLTPKPSLEKTLALEKKYTLAKTKNFMDAWAQLYIREGGDQGLKWNFRDFERKDFNVILGDSVITIWDNNPRTSLHHEIESGTYQLKLLTNGTPYKSVYPHLNVYLNDSLLGSFNTQADYALSPPLVFSITNRRNIIVKVKMDNDENDSKTQEDRNAFTKSGLYI